MKSSHPSRTTPSPALYLALAFSWLGSLPGLAQSAPAVNADGAKVRRAAVSWTPVKNADFYIVRYGIAPNKLFSNYQIYSQDEMTLNALNAGVSYWVTVDAVNDSGVTRGPDAVALP